MAIVNETVITKKKKKKKKGMKKLVKREGLLPDPPIVQGIQQQAAGATDVERRLVKAGRRGTLLTGQLAPKRVGKKGLLG